MDSLDINLAVRCLQEGGVIGYPTEAVWGLGCDPADQQAVLRLLSIKNRSVDKGLILIAASMTQIDPLLRKLPTALRARLESSWPGPHTWLIPDPENLVPPWIKGCHQSVAVRVSDHPVVRQLCMGFGGPLVSTSANAAGKPEIRSRLRLRLLLGAKLDRVVKGNLGNSARPSTITDLLSGTIIR